MPEEDPSSKSREHARREATPGQDSLSYGVPNTAYPELEASPTVQSGQAAVRDHVGTSSPLDDDGC